MSTIEPMGPKKRNSGRISPESAYLQLAEHPRWVVERDRLYRDYRFPSFMDAVAFINRVAAVAERQDHHPNITLHEYFFLRLELYSHLEGALHQKDVDLAKAIDRLESEQEAGSDTRGGAG